MVKKIISVALLSAFLALGSADVSAADISAFPGATVTNDGNAYTIVVNSDAMLTENITFPASATVTINGNSHTITRDSSYTGVGFSIPSDTAVTINNLILDGNAPDWAIDLSGVNYYAGSDGTRIYARFPLTIGTNDVSATGSFIDNRGDLTLSNSTIKNNLISGAMAVWNRKNLTVVDSTFDHNCARTTYGGAIYSAGGTLTISGSTFSNNDSGSSASLVKRGGAININSGTATISDSAFTNNSAATDGGAIMVEDASVDISNSTFRGNFVGNDGSAVALNGTQDGHHVANFANNKFIENKSLTYGRNKGNGEGTVCTYGKSFETITFDGDEFTDNQASWGSVMSIYDEGNAQTLKNVVLKNIKMSGNLNTGNANALNIQHVDNVTIENIDAKNGSGSIIIYDSDTLNLSNVVTDVSWQIIEVKDATIEGVEVINTHGDTTTYFLVENGETLTTKDFSAKDFNSDYVLPGIYEYGSADLQNIDSDGAIVVSDIETVTADTIVGGYSTYDSISFSRIDSLTAKNIFLEDFATEGSALSIYNVTTADLENVSIKNIEASGYSLMEIVSSGVVNVKNLVVDGNTNTNTDGNGIVEIYDSSNAQAPENRSITFENAQITNNHSAGHGGGLMVTSRNVAITFDENSRIINNESGLGGDDVYIVETDGTPAVITLPNVIWEDKQEEEATILGSIVISDGGAHYLKVTTIPEENPATGDELNIAIIGAVSGIALVGAFIIHTRRSFRR